jgi:hypothetical protein
MHGKPQNTHILKDYIGMLIKNVSKHIPPNPHPIPKRAHPNINFISVLPF